MSIEGDSEEIEALVTSLSGKDVTSLKDALARASTARGKAVPKTETETSARGPTGYIKDLKAKGFFGQKRAISDIQDKLEEEGHIYSLENLSPTLLRLVRTHVLRRIREDGSWKYVNP